MGQSPILYQPPGKKFGDFALYVDNGLLHCIHIEREKGPRHNEIGNTFGLSVSRDGFNWEYKGTILKNTGSWDGYLMGMDIRKENGKIILMYTARKSNSEMETQQTGLIETDNIMKMTNPLVPLITNVVGENYHPSSLGKFAWRDPFIFKHEGKYYSLIVAKDSSRAAENSGCIGLLSSDDLKNWNIEAPIFSPGYPELETPAIYQREGKFFLTFGNYTNKMSMRYAVSDNIFGPFIEPEKNILTPSLSYAGRIIDFNGTNDVFFHWIRNQFTDKQETYMAPPKIAVFEDSKMLLKKHPGSISGVEYEVRDSGLKINITQQNSHDVSIKPYKHGILVEDFGRNFDIVYNEHTLPLPRKAKHIAEVIRLDNLLEVYVDGFYAYGSILDSSDSIESRVTVPK